MALERVAVPLEVRDGLVLPTGAAGIIEPAPSAPPPRRAGGPPRRVAAPDRHHAEVDEPARISPSPRPRPLNPSRDPPTPRRTARAAWGTPSSSCARVIHRVDRRAFQRDRLPGRSVSSGGRATSSARSAAFSRRWAVVVVACARRPASAASARPQSCPPRGERAIEARKPVVRGRRARPRPPPRASAWAAIGGATAATHAQAETRARWGRRGVRRGEVRERERRRGRVTSQERAGDGDGLRSGLGGAVAGESVEGPGFFGRRAAPGVERDPSDSRRISSSPASRARGPRPLVVARGPHHVARRRVERAPRRRGRDQRRIARVTRLRVDPGPSHHPAGSRPVSELQRERAPGAAARQLVERATTSLSRGGSGRSSIADGRGLPTSPRAGG